MSTIVIAKYRANIAAFQKLIESHPADLIAVARARRERGCISHRYAVSDGDLYVIDEWPSADTYNEQWPNDRGWPHELAVEIDAMEPPEITYLHVVPDPGSFYHFPE
jgi:hypothetical protein